MIPIVNDVTSPEHAIRVWRVACIDRVDAHAGHEQVTTRRSRPRRGPAPPGPAAGHVDRYA